MFYKKNLELTHDIFIWISDKKVQIKIKEIFLKEVAVGVLFSKNLKPELKLKVLF